MTTVHACSVHCQATVHAAFMLFLIAIVVACFSTSQTSTTSAAHRVAGIVMVEPSPGFAFLTTLDVQQDSSGRVAGRVVTRILDLSSRAIATTGDIEQKPECMRVVGHTAYISTHITKTFDERVGKVGERAVFWVEDAGSNGTDIAYGGPASVWDPTHAICTSTPPKLPVNRVVEGDISVR